MDKTTFAVWPSLSLTFMVVAVGTRCTLRFYCDRYGNDLDPGGFVDEIAVTPLAAFSAPVTAVPEPASVGGLALAAVVIATRRLRRRRLEQRS